MRLLILSLLRWSGFMWLWRFLHRYEVIILTVHGVMDTEAQTAWVPLRSQLPPRRLDELICALSKCYRFVSLKDAVDMLAARTPVRPYSLAVTFDDGYRNQIKHALPVLRRYGVPATFFMVTGHIEHRKPFWFDRLDYALQHASVDGRRVEIGKTTITLRATDRATLQASYKRLRDAAKAVARPDTEMVQELESIAARLEAESGRRLADILEEDDWSAVATWKEIQAATGDDVSFGSHTVDHVRLGLTDAASIRDQLTRSKAMIERHVGQPCRHLCYPDGSFNQEAVEIARACGYEAATTAVEGANRVGDDPMTLRRIDLAAGQNLTDTLARVSGISSAQSKLAARLRSVLSGRPFGKGARQSLPPREVLEVGRER